MLEKIFPETIFVRKWIRKFGRKKAFTKQLSVIAEEAFEAQGKFSQENYDGAIGELTDVLQATYTAIRMIPGYTPKKVSDEIRKMIDKNDKRGYYPK